MRVAVGTAAFSRSSGRYIRPSAAVTTSPSAGRAFRPESDVSAASTFPRHTSSELIRQGLAKNSKLATFDVESLYRGHWSCSVNRLTAEWAYTKRLTLTRVVISKSGKDHGSLYVCSDTDSRVKTGRRVSDHAGVESVVRSGIGA